MYVIVWSVTEEEEEDEEAALTRGNKMLEQTESNGDTWRDVEEFLTLFSAKKNSLRKLDKNVLNTF